MRVYMNLTTAELIIAYSVYVQSGYNGAPVYSYLGEAVDSGEGCLMIVHPSVLSNYWKYEHIGMF